MSTNFNDIFQPIFWEKIQIILLEISKTKVSEKINVESHRTYIANRDILNSNTYVTELSDK